MFTIYLITCMTNGKQYVGATKYPIRRWRQHLNWSQYTDKEYSRRGCGALHPAMHKHGATAFTFKTLRSTMSLEKACMLERQYIRDLNTLAPHGYNLAAGGVEPNGELRFGRKVTQEFREKISASWSVGREARIRQMTAALASTAVRATISKKLRLSWSNPEVRIKRFEAAKRGRATRRGNQQ